MLFQRFPQDFGIGMTDGIFAETVAQNTTEESF